MPFSLSKPASEIDPAYDVIVVGSGYGGGVSACRLARSGLRVAVLERGREYAPGEFPTNAREATKALQVNGPSHTLGSPTALFDVRAGRDVHVLKACGLGGTSLINAGVCLAPDERVFLRADWPAEIKSDGLLAEGYLKARAMLRPAAQPGWKDLPKVKALAIAGIAFNETLQPAPIHVAFESGPNAAGVQQPACTACGDCCGGCNVGAKTTVRNTYLADAEANGAHIFTLCDVRAVARGGDGSWRVSYRVFDGDEPSSERAVSAGIVILAAGTLGSTEILMRSRAAGLAVSDQLGRHVTSNGDAIALAYNTVHPVHAVGIGHPARAGEPPVGAAVNALMDLRDGLPLEDGLAIVECALPSSLAPMLPAMLSAGAGVFGQDGDLSLKSEAGEMVRSMASFAGGPYRGAVHNTETFLAVGHDAGDGEIAFENDRAALHWPGAAKQQVFARIEETLKKASYALGGTYLRNPASQDLLGGNLLTVHPLGGCVMAADRNGGVVNHKCQVFDARTSAYPSAVHAGLYVIDGSVIPCSLGVHPLLTITAIAERALMHLIHDRGLKQRPMAVIAAPAIAAPASAVSARPHSPITADIAAAPARRFSLWDFIAGRWQR